MNHLFSRLARLTSDNIGRPRSFMVAVGTVVVWAACGPIFGYSDTWQLVINTGTTIVTFLMVFLIAHQQAVTDKAVHLKLDGINAGLADARDDLQGIEVLSDEQIEALKHSS